MLTFSISDDIGNAMSAIEDISYRLFDLRPLAQRIAIIMEAQNAANRGLGLDRYGVPFVPLAESTMRKRIRQGRLGPPLAPDGPGSPIDGGFQVAVEAKFPDDILLRGHWPGVPWVGYHTDNGGPRSRLPVRDPAGLPADAEDQIADEFNDFLAGLFAATY